jgi:hypothetical protein
LEAKSEFMRLAAVCKRMIATETRVLTLSALFLVALHSATNNQYGFHRDERKDESILGLATRGTDFICGIFRLDLEGTNPWPARLIVEPLCPHGYGRQSDRPNSG